MPVWATRVAMTFLGSGGEQTHRSAGEEHGEEKGNGRSHACQSPNSHFRVWSVALWNIPMSSFEKTVIVVAG